MHSRKSSCLGTQSRRSTSNHQHLVRLLAAPNRPTFSRGNSAHWQARTRIAEAQAACAAGTSAIATGTDRGAGRSLITSMPANRCISVSQSAGGSLTAGPRVRNSRSCCCRCTDTANGRGYCGKDSSEIWSSRLYSRSPFLGSTGMVLW